MKSTPFKRLSIAFTIAALMAGCSSGVKLDDVPVEDKGATSTTGGGAGAGGAGQSGVAPVDLSQSSRDTDDRGGREYNLALGQKRAEAVRRSLGLLGVSDAQVEAVSYGKEKPAVQGNNESAFAQNRRVELSYR